MRLAPYYAYYSTAVTAAVAAGSIALVDAGASPLWASFACGAAAVHTAAVGVALAMDWRGSARRLSAIARIKNRSKGRFWRWVCRDSLTAIRMCGVLLVPLAVCQGVLAVFFARP